MQLGQEMKQEIPRKKNLGRQFNALLRLIQRVGKEQILPQEQRKQNDVIGRTQLAIQGNPLIRDRNNTKGIKLGNEFIPMVTRETRDFNKKLCSVGSSLSREVILLDPNDQLLRTHYEKLKIQLPPITDPDPQVILEKVKKLTRDCFIEKKPDSFIKENIRNGKQIISLSEFISKKQGVCRHHALLNAYFLSRLVQDGLLQGEVIHHRQNFDQGAHTWNIFHAKNGKVYSLDSFWDNVTCITDNPGALDSLYSHNVEAKIKKMHFAVRVKESDVKEQRKSIAQAAAILKKHLCMKNLGLQIIQGNFKPLPNPPSAAEKINQIKHYIENINFPVGDYFLWKGGLILKLEDGREKRVPHRVYEIYQTIRKSDQYLTNPLNTQKLWQNVQMHAQKALDHPRIGRDSKTTAFYNSIVSDNMSLLKEDHERAIENKPPAV
jgi:hypothetical protein